MIIRTWLGFLTGDDKIGPAGGVLEVNSLDVQVGGVLSIEQNRSEVGVGSVKNLLAGKLCILLEYDLKYDKRSHTVPPSLTVTVQNTLSVKLDVLATPLPEHDRVLQPLVSAHHEGFSDIPGKDAYKHSSANTLCHW